jgi:hypothetical protein
MRALWLPGVLHAAGLTVHEVPGWKSRGRDTWGPVRGITCHHTAGSRNSSIQGEINVLLNGSTSAPPPIAQLFLARNGEWYVVASGHCNHNKVGWDGPNEGYGNDALLGIEAQHSGGSEPWTPLQYNSYVRGVAALVRHNATGWAVTVSRVAGHKEHQPGAKSDPTFNMNTFRDNVNREIKKMNAPKPPPPKQEEDDMPTVEEIWSHGLVNPYTGKTQPARDFLRYAPSAQPTRDVLTAVTGLLTEFRAFVTAEDAADTVDSTRLDEIIAKADEAGAKLDRLIADSEEPESPEPPAGT